MVGGAIGGMAPAMGGAASCEAAGGVIGCRDVGGAA